jgi:K+-transporting ATPase A subunit
MVTDATRSLRWYGGLAVLVFGIGPAVMLTLLVVQDRTPGSVGVLLIFAIPLVLLALFIAGLGMTGSDPELTSRRMHLAMALVAGADVLMLGGNWVIRTIAG